LIGVLRRRRPDLVHAHSLKAGVIGGLACRVAGVPMVWQVRDRIDDDYLPKAAVRLVRWLVPRVSAAVVTYPATREDLHLPAGTDVVAIGEPYRASNAPSVAARPARADDGALRVGILGRIAPWKGQDVFLEAFARAFPDGGATAVVAGAPLFGEDEYDQLLRERVTALRIGDRVEFAGFVDDVPGLLAGLDVLVHASVIPEPHGQVVVEGMAAGLAVIASAAGGPAEIVTDGSDGLLVTPGDVEALAGALHRLAEDPALRERLGAAARRRAADFDPDRVVPVIHDVYARVMSRARCRR
jgi:glycosyltransferase involved in cell wall biosynthesis